MSFVTLERNGAVGVITMNRPEALNALNGEVLADLSAVLDEVANDDSILVAIVTGGILMKVHGVAALAIAHKVGAAAGKEQQHKAQQYHTAASHKLNRGHFQIMQMLIISIHV